MRSSRASEILEQAVQRLPNLPDLDPLRRPLFRSQLFSRQLRTLFHLFGLTNDTARWNMMRRGFPATTRRDVVPGRFNGRLMLTQAIFIISPDSAHGYLLLEE